LAVVAVGDDEEEEEEAPRCFRGVLGDEDGWGFCLGVKGRPASVAGVLPLLPLLRSESLGSANVAEWYNKENINNGSTLPTPLSFPPCIEAILFRR